MSELKENTNMKHVYDAYNNYYGQNNDTDGELNEQFNNIGEILLKTPDDREIELQTDEAFKIIETRST